MRLTIVIIQVAHDTKTLQHWSRRANSIVPPLHMQKIPNTIASQIRLLLQANVTKHPAHQSNSNQLFCFVQL